MKQIARLKGGLFVMMFVLAAASGIAEAQTTKITTEYLMTVYALLDPPQVIDKTLFVYNVRDGGWVKVLKLAGNF